jgi:hypothetical protein
MSKMNELLKQKEEIEKAIAEEAKAGRAEAVKTVREMIKQYKMTATDLKGLLKTRRTKAQIEADKQKKAATVAKKSSK